MIAIFVLSSCSSNRSSEVSDRSTQAYKGRIYQVGRGDTLASIALKYGLSYRELADFNGIKSPFTIYPGQRLRVDVHMAKGRNGSFSSPNAEANSGHNSRSVKRTNRGNLSSKNSNYNGTVKWQWPSRGKLLALFQSENGLNKGIDIGGKLGEPVLAAASGDVVYAGGGLPGYGKLLIIKHNDTFLSAYAHNSELLVKEGESVKAGQRIADMGSSGTDRVKLHFEIRSDGNPVDPLKYLPKH